MIAPKKKTEEEIQEGSPLCEKCGSRLVLESEELICPNCDTEIDFFGDEKKEKE